MENSNYMQLKLNSVIIDISTFAREIEEILIESTYADKINIEDLKFECGKELDLEFITSIDDIINYKVPIFDYYLYRHLISKKLLSSSKLFKLNEDLESFDFNKTNLSNAIVYLYLNIVTRGKPTLEIDEYVQGLYKSYFKMECNPILFNRLLSSNSLNKFEHNWIKLIDINKFSNPIKSRLSMGIAGHRHLNIFKNYEWKKDISKECLELLNILKEIAITGPYWAFHPLLKYKYPLLTNISLNNNLENIIIDNYDSDMIKLMVKDKALYSIPSRKKNSFQYKSWKKDTFNFLKEEDKVFKEKF